MYRVKGLNKKRSLLCKFINYSIEQCNT